MELHEIVSDHSLVDVRLPLLSWLPGETLFSMASRLHSWWGHGTPSRTSEVLFGERRRGWHHDFPNALDLFVERTNLQLGQAAEIARARTLLSFFIPFSSSEVVEAIVRRMGGASVAHLKFHIGLLTSRFRANHPLKACSMCTQSDASEHGWSYWHLEHQYPGVWICPVHGSPLRTSRVKSNGVERFGWMLPTNFVLGPEPSAKEDVVDVLSAFATLVTSLVTHSAEAGWLSPSLVQSTVHARLRSRGLMTPGGQLRLRAAAADYLQHCAPLRNVPELQALPATLESSALQLGRLLRPLRSGTHPLRLLSVIHWLFESAEEFVKEHGESVFPGIDAPTQQLRMTGYERYRRDRLVEQIRDGSSATSAAKEAGVSVVTAMAWAAQAGISTPRRPKFLNESVHAALTQALRRGISKSEASRTYGVSTQTVNRVLRTEVGLHVSWKAAQLSATQAFARATWLALLADHHALGVKLLRAMSPATYAWLYRNDRAWLLSHPADPLIRVPNASLVAARWDEMDVKLCQAVEQTVLRLAGLKPAKRLRLWQIYQELPELKPKLSALTRLPLTKRALEIALGRSAARQAASEPLL